MKNNNKNDHACDFFFRISDNADRRSNFYQQQDEWLTQKWVAWKTHNVHVARSLEQEAKAKGNCTVYWFITTPSGTPDDKFAVFQNSTIYFEKGFPYIEDMIRKEYAEILQLDSMDVDALISFMKTYEPLRRCCGFQASTRYMEILKELGPMNQTAVGKHEHEDHFCFHVNVTELERQFLATDLSVHYQSLRQAEGVPGLLDGTWCASAERLLRKGVTWNAKNVQQITNMSIKDAIENEREALISYLG